MKLKVVSFQTKNLLIYCITKVCFQLKTEQNLKQKNILLNIAEQAT